MLRRTWALPKKCRCQFASTQIFRIIRFITLTITGNFISLCVTFSFVWIFVSFIAANLFVKSHLCSLSPWICIRLKRIFCRCWQFFFHDQMANRNAYRLILITKPFYMMGLINSVIHFIIVHFVVAYENQRVLRTLYCPFHPTLTRSHFPVNS